MGPIDYTINAMNPLDTMLKGMAGGLQIRGLQQEQELQRQQAEIERQKTQAQAAKYEAEMQDILRNQQLQDDYRQAISGDPKSIDMSRAWALTGLMPKDAAKAAQEALAGMTTEQQNNILKAKTDIAGLLLAGDTDSVKAKFETELAARENAGDQAGANALKMMIAQLDENPTAVYLQNLAEMQFLPKGKEAVEALGQIHGVPSAVRKAEAEAVTAEAVAKQEGVKAKYSESNALRDLEKKGWDITKIKSDIEVSRMNSRIYAMNAALSREANDLKRQELTLKIEEAIRNRDDAIKNKANEAETVVASLSDAKSALDDILGDKDTLRAAVGASAWRSAIPGTAARTMAGKIEQLQNMMTEANLGKLKGAMSDSDLKFLRNIGTNLDRYQNEEAFIKELTRISSVIDRSLGQQRRKYGIPIEQPSGPISVDY